MALSPLCWADTAWADKLVKAYHWHTRALTLFINASRRDSGVLHGGIAAQMHVDVHLTAKPNEAGQVFNEINELTPTGPRRVRNDRGRSCAQNRGCLCKRRYATEAEGVTATAEIVHKKPWLDGLLEPTDAHGKPLAPNQERKQPMKRSALSLVVLALLVSSAAFAQSVPAAYTESKEYVCDQEVCNGAPLDGGGTWQFILANRTISFSPTNGLDLCGNPASTACPGGITLICDHTIYPTQPGRGPQGVLTFRWTAVERGDLSVRHSGYSVVNGFQTKKCFLHGCWFVLTIVNMQSYITR